ncbi:hypothetical protein BDZ89DRAFT_1050873 [Hymenopellis radicata]|nr:hypothetical protein BDZ89DRAFT_1050873 [Hymenopellis radicata]
MFTYSMVTPPRLLTPRGFRPSRRVAPRAGSFSAEKLEEAPTAYTGRVSRLVGTHINATTAATVKSLNKDGDWDDGTERLQSCAKCASTPPSPAFYFSADVPLLARRRGSEPSFVPRYHFSLWIFGVEEHRPRKPFIKAADLRADGDDHLTGQGCINGRKDGARQAVAVRRAA